jgi:hypothetical protein
MVILGVIGAWISQYLGAPGYFGGTIGVVLTGLIALFVLAARIANKS